MHHPRFAALVALPLMLAAQHALATQQTTVPGDLAPITTSTYEIRSIWVSTAGGGQRICVAFPFQPTSAEVTATVLDRRDMREHVVAIPAMALVGRGLVREHDETEYFIQRTEKNVCIEYTGDNDLAGEASQDILLGEFNEPMIRFYVKAMK